MLLIEISPMIEHAVRELLTAGGSWHVEPTIKDLAGHARVIVAQAVSGMSERRGGLSRFLRWLQSKMGLSPSPRVFRTPSAR